MNLISKSLLTGIVLTLGMLGCAQAPTLDFVPREVRPSTTKINAEVKSITISIASEDERLGETQVGFYGNQYETSFKSSFKDAIEEAIMKSAIFNDIADLKVSLVAKILKFQSPSMGVNFDTEMVVRYELINRKDGQPIFHQDVTSNGSISGTYAFLGAIRYTEARNVAVRNNVANFIAALSAYKAADKAGSHTEGALGTGSPSSN